MGRVIAEKEVPASGARFQRNPEPAGFEIVFVCGECGDSDRLYYPDYPGIRQLDSDREKIRRDEIVCEGCELEQLPDDDYAKKP